MLCWSLVARAAPVATGPTELAVDVVGPLAELVATRRFHNDETVPIDTELWFAIPPGGAVDGLTITIGTRTIESTVVAREEAAERYVEAANQGKMATILEQHQADVAVQRIANVLPGEDIAIELRLVVPVDRHDGVWELVLPLVVAPRLQDPDGEGPTYVAPADPGRVPLRDQVDATIRVQTGTALRWIESPSHPFRSQLGANEGHLWIDGVRADRDLVVRWATAASDTAISLLVGEGHGLLLIEPPAPFVRLEPPGADVVLLVDASDTMAGARWARTLAAVEELLAGLREQDTFTLLVFADTVRGLAVRQPASAAAVAEALFALEHAALGGATNLALGLRFAVAVPSPPERARTLVVLSDGGTDQDVLAILPPRTTVHTVAIGGATNLALLRTLASRGGGVSVTVRPDQDVGVALHPVLEGLRGPVLTDVTVVFGAGDVTVETPLPSMYPDRMVAITERGLDCVTAAVVRGKFVGRPFEEIVRPTCTDRSRPLRVMWARSEIAAIEAQDPAGAQRLALEYGIVSAYTSLLGVDSAVHNPPGTAIGAPLPVLVPSDVRVAHSMAGSTEEITVLARRQTVDTESTSATRYVVDGASVDPVTGTFSLNFNFDALQSMGRDEWRLAEYPGGMPPLAVRSLPATNNFHARAGLRRIAGVESAAGLGLDQIASEISGPLLRDQAWSRVAYDFDRSTVAGRDFVGHTGAFGVAAQPNPEHRLQLSGAGDTTTVTLPDGAFAQSSLLGTGQWQWFLSPEVNFLTAVAGQRQTLDGDRRQRLQVSERASALSVDDGLDGWHDIVAGADVEATDWTLSRASAAWLGLQPPPDVDQLRVGLYSQDGYHPSAIWFVDVGIRSDITLGRPHLAPQLHVALDPWGRDRTKIAAGFGRYYGHLGLPTSVLSPEAGLSRLDEWQAVVEGEVVEDFALGFEGALRDRRDLPVFGGGRADQRSWYARVYLQKIQSRRWRALLSWRYTELLEGIGPILVDDGTLDGFAHAADGEIVWDLPTDPWTLSVGLFGRWYEGPLGTLVPDPTIPSLPNVPRRSAGIVLIQAVDLPHGRLELTLEGSWVDLLDDPRDLSDWNWVRTPILDQATASGPRVLGGVAFAFD